MSVKYFGCTCYCLEQRSRCVFGLIVNVSSFMHGPRRYFAILNLDKTEYNKIYLSHRSVWRLPKELRPICLFSHEIFDAFQLNFQINIRQIGFIEMIFIAAFLWCQDKQRNSSNVFGCRLPAVLTVLWYVFYLVTVFYLSNANPSSATTI